MNKTIIGFLLGALAAASYGTNPLFALPLLNAGIDAYSVLFLRYMFAIPMLALLMVSRGRGFGLRRQQVVPLIVLGFLMAFSSLTLYVSYAYIGAAIASTLLFVYPILVTLIMAFFFHEHASATTVGCIVLAMIGIGLLYRGDGNEVLDLRGLALVFVSALSYACYLVAVNHPKMRVIPTLKLTLYVIVFGLFLFVFKFNIHALQLLSAHPLLWLDAVAMALFPTALSLVCTSAAIQKIGSTPVAVLGALEPVTAVFFAVTIFKEPLTVQLAVGMALVILSVSILIGQENVHPILLRVRKMFPRIKKQ